MKHKNILHITSHLGGGVGRVVLNYLKKSIDSPKYIHQIASLDYINEDAKKQLNNSNIKYKDKLSADYKSLLSVMESADIILIHWWNHPLMYEFLVKYTPPKSRVIIWSHTSGFYAPAIFVKPLFDYADKFIFTTPISYEVDMIKGLSSEQKTKLGVVWSTGGLEHVKDVKLKEHQGFNVGYLGTVDYSKLYKDFLEISASVDVDTIKFIVCGGDDEKDIEEEARVKNIGNKFNFLGKVKDIGKYLAQFDVFAYPLSPYHYGTCDQVLAEAMACGIVPVVFDNPMEKYMVEDGKTGLVVKNKIEYKEAIEKLYNDKEFRDSLSRNTKEEAFKRFSLETMLEEWEDIFDECMSTEKTSKEWNGKYKGIGVTPFQIFIESTGELGKYFEEAVFLKNKENKIKKIMEHTNTWKSKSKGTLNHYLSFFEDENLKKLNKIIS